MMVSYSKPIPVRLHPEDVERLNAYPTFNRNAVMLAAIRCGLAAIDGDASMVLKWAGDHRCYRKRAPRNP